MTGIPAAATVPARPPWLAALPLALLSPGVFAAATPAAGPETFLQGLQEMNGMEVEGLPGYRFRTGAYYSDNVTLSTEEELDELVGVAEFGANWHSVGTRFAAAADGTLAYRHYTRNDFDDEGRANFQVIGDIFIIPETLDWYVTDRLANAPVDPLASTSPLNVQFVNVLETGPRLTLRPGGRNELTLSVARADIHAEETPIDHERDTGAFSFMHGISANSSFGIMADVRKVKFEPEAEASDFDQEEAHLHYQSRNETAFLSVAGGKSRFELADGSGRDTTTGWIRFRAQRTSDSYIYAALERTANDTATAMVRDELLLEEGGVPSFIVTGDPFFSNTAILRYTRGWRGHEWFAAINARELDYFVSLLDREQRALQLGAQFTLTPRLEFSVTATGIDIEYIDLLRSDTVSMLLTEADYRIGRNWSLTTGVRRLERDSSDTTYGFAETMLTLFLNYVPSRPQQ